MIEITRKIFPFKIKRILYNNNLILKLNIFTVYRLDQSVALDIPKKYIIYKNKFNTTKINLQKTADEIFKAFDKKSTQYEIKKAEKELTHITIKINSDFDDFIDMSQKFYELRYGIKRDIAKEIKYYKDFSDLINIYYDNKLISGIYLIKDYPNRVRLLLSHSRYLENNDLKAKSNYLNRYIHWFAIQKYKKEKYLEYDFGGVDLDTNAKTKGITKFKLSFGGEVIEEYNYFISLTPKIIELVYHNPFNRQNK